MFDETEVPAEGETPTVPVKATATGTIRRWYYEAQEKVGNELQIISEGDLICVIDVKTNDILTPTRSKHVYAPSKGYIDKIIKEAGDVEEGETIAEWKPVPTVPLRILDRYGFSSIG